MEKDEQKHLEALLKSIAKLIFVWRMASGLLGSGSPSVASAAEKRRMQALEELAAILARHNEEKGSQSLEDVAAIFRRHNEEL